MSAVSENIKKYRQLKGLKQVELAQMLGKSHNVISSWEAETNRPDVDSIAKMLKIFEIDANTLFSWDDEIKNDVDLRNGFYRIHNGIATKYADLSPENQKVIDAHIDFLLNQQKPD